MTDQKRPRQKHSAKAYDEGKEARESGKARESCPYTPDQRPQTRAWESGWDSLGPLTNVHVAAPAGVQVRVTASVGAYYVVPEGEDLKAMLTWSRVPTNLVPCGSCRRIRLDSGSPACVSNGPRFKGAPVVEVFCRSCGTTTKVPVRG